MDNKLPAEVYATVAGAVDTGMVQRFFQAFSIAVNGGVQTVHLLFQSPGGLVGDGVAIYNYIRNLPLEVVAYNGGSVMSIATIAFLGAGKRNAAKTASFMIHKTHVSLPSAAGSNTLQVHAKSLASDDARTELILRGHLKMPDDKWEQHKWADLHISAAEALEFGLVHEIVDFVPPKGAQIFNI